MTAPNVKPEAWVARVVRALRKHESWTGRMHIHKSLFVAQILELAEPPFEFELYRYGPYSFDLDDTIAAMDAYGDLCKTYQQPGYGARYQCTTQGEKLADDLGEADSLAVDRVAKHVGHYGSAGLELIATCLWVELRDRLKDEEEIVKRVRRIKPRYHPDQIQQRLKLSRELAASLGSVR